MHECPNCGQACACDGEDTWFDEWANCECPCDDEEADDDLYGDEDDYV